MENCDFFFLFVGSILASFILCRIEFRPNDGTYLADGWYDFLPSYGTGFNEVVTWTRYDTMPIRQSKITYYGTQVNFTQSYQIFPPQIWAEIRSLQKHENQRKCGHFVENFKTLHQLIYRVKSFSVTNHLS